MSASKFQEQIERIAKSADRLAQFKAMGAPDIILRNERRVMHDATRVMRAARSDIRMPVVDAAHAPHAA